MSVRKECEAVRKQNEEEKTVKKRSKLGKKRSERNLIEKDPDGKKERI